MNHFWKSIFIGLLVALPVVGIPGGAAANSRQVWVAYWDLGQVDKELRALKGNVDNISYFAAYFDKEDKLFVPDEIVRQKQSQGKKQYGTYLTIVNDKVGNNGRNLLKDQAVLRRMFQDDASMQKHAEDIVSLALAGQYDGIEIDYEGIWKTEDVGQKFLAFTYKLQRLALKNDLKLRIVLEPEIPFDAAFCRGPEYVVMMYNLYGLHSGPGPKADRSFIWSVLGKMQALPGDKGVAFATGGCRWGSNGEKRLLTEAAAVKLAKEQKAVLRTDVASGCKVFSYQDKGVAYEVWYADADTLNFWVDAAAAFGTTDVSLWRLGGNTDLSQLRW